MITGKKDRIGEFVGFQALFFPAENSLHPRRYFCIVRGFRGFSLCGRSKSHLRYSWELLEFLDVRPGIARILPLQKQALKSLPRHPLPKIFPASSRRRRLARRSLRTVRITSSRSEKANWRELRRRKRRRRPHTMHRRKIRIAAKSARIPFPLRSRRRQPGTRLARFKPTIDYWNCWKKISTKLSNKLRNGGAWSFPRRLSTTPKYATSSSIIRRPEKPVSASC